ncbi:hypothetical protein [Streptomyces sp. NPDC006879]|uniref:hypothetical protein n=1 Tax=Streptomyces sp. NPDC006879 TaxID=3364767 RepID=UPI003694D6A1
MVLAFRFGLALGSGVDGTLRLRWPGLGALPWRLRRRKGLRRAVEVRGVARISGLLRTIRVRRGTTEGNGLPLTGIPASDLAGFILLLLGLRAVLVRLPVVLRLRLNLLLRVRRGILLVVLRVLLLLRLGMRLLSMRLLGVSLLMELLRLRHLLLLRVLLRRTSVRHLDLWVLVAVPPLVPVQRVLWVPRFRA